MKPRSNEYLVNSKAASAFLDKLHGQLFPCSLTEDFLWKSLPGPQTQVLNTEAFETLYGGSAGSGKSSVIVGLTKLQSRAALILRRTFPELEGSVIQESLKWYGDPKHYNQSKHIWQWPDGQRIRFGYAETIKDVFQYQSAEFDTLCFDELTQWSNSHVYEYLLSRIRTVRKGQRCRVVSGTNPGNVGCEWVIYRWRPWLDSNHPNPAKPGELRWFRRDEKGQDIECESDHPDAVSRTYIPALLADNPYLGDDYKKQLKSLPEPWRSQLLNGDWSAGREDDPGQLIKAHWVDASMKRWEKPSGDHLTATGIDVARGGKDLTVLANRYDSVIDELTSIPGILTPDGPAVVRVVVEALGQQQPLLGIDILAVGTSPFDDLRELGYDITAINGNAKALDYYGKQVYDKSGRLKMRNLRSAMCWKLRDLLEAGSIDLPPDNELRAELLSLHWDVSSLGVLIEDKKAIKARLGRSTNKLDAVMYAVWVQPTPVTIPLSQMVFG